MGRRRVRVSQSVIASRRLDPWRVGTAHEYLRMLQDVRIQRNLFLQNERARIASLLRELEDRRQFHPDGKARPVRDRASRGARFAIGSGNRTQFFFGSPLLPSGSLAVSPKKKRGQYTDRVLVCVRRKARKEVLFAKGFGGGRVSRRRRRNELSNVFC